MSELDHLLDNLERASLADVDIPDEVTDCIKLRQEAPNVLFIATIRATSPSSKATLARQLTALANTGQLLGSRPGYLIFEIKGSILQTPQSNDVLELSDLQVSHVEDILTHLLTDHLNPLSGINCRFQSVFSKYGYIEVTLKNFVPAYLKKSSSSDACELLINSRSVSSQKWLIQIASPEQTKNLHKHHLITALNQDTNANREKILKSFDSNLIQSSFEYAGFLTGLLLWESVENRCFATHQLTRIGGLDAKTRQLIAQLLTSLLYDEAEVAIQAAKSLSIIGFEEQNRLIIQATDYYISNREILESVLLCIAEIGSPSSINDIQNIYQKAEKSEIVEVIEKVVIPRLYERHNIPVFDEIKRTEFLREIESFQYGSALELLNQNGKDICLDQSYRNCIELLVQYGIYRSNLKLQDATTTLAEGLHSNQMNEIDRELHKTLDKWTEFPGTIEEPSEKDPIPEVWKVTELFYLIDNRYLLRNYENFLGSLYNFLENLSFYLLRGAGIELYKKKNYVYIDNEWKKHNTKTKNFLYLPTNRINTKEAIKIVEGCSEKSKNVEKVYDLLVGFNRLMDLRNKLPTAHGFETPNEEQIIKTYKKKPSEIISDIRDLFFYATSHELGANPYLELNNDIKYILNVSGIIPISARSLLAA